MYPRNADTPPRIAVGQVVQISDGAIQTAGCSATVTPEGGAEAAAAGTLACLATSGVWVYTPTQPETNYTAFVVAVYKAACLSACATVVTTAAPVAGNVTIAASQPNYAPAKAGDAMTLTAAYEAAKTAAQESTANAIGVIVSAIASILSGITSLAAWLRGLYRKDAMEATAKAEVNQGGGTYDESTDSVEAIRERGDAAWGGGGGSCVWLPAEKDAVVDKMASIGSGTVVVRSPITADGKTITVTPGDDLVASIGRSIDLALAYPTWADLSTASVVLKVYDRLAGRWTTPWLEVAGVILDGGTADQAARFEMAAAITTRFERLGIDAYSWRAFAYLVGGQTITIGAGDVDVLPASEA